MIALLLIAAFFGGLWVFALAMGNGRCHDCGRPCPPWSAFCGEHDPFRSEW